MQPFQEIMQRFRGSPFEVVRIPIERLCIIQYVCCQRITQEIPLRSYHSSSPLPGHYGTSIFSANTRSERQSF